MTMRQLAPYIGVTGFTSAEEIRAVVAANPPTIDRLLMCGVLASEKTYRGQPSKYPDRYPLIGDIAKIFLPLPNVINLVHYAAKPGRVELIDELLHVYDLAGPHCHGFQLNMSWPGPSSILLYDLRRRLPNSVIVAQIGPSIMERCNTSLTLGMHVADNLADYADYILIDGSGGRGRPFDIDRVRSYICGIRNYCRAHASRVPGLAFAGGLGPGAMYGTNVLFAESQGNLSCDAEGRLRDNQDHLVISRVNDYVREALEQINGR